MQTVNPNALVRLSPGLAITQHPESFLGKMRSLPNFSLTSWSRGMSRPA
jgi:hypothetical protein